MQAKVKRLPMGRPEGTPQPSGGERIKRQQRVIWDSLLKRAVAGEPEAVKLCIDLGLISPESEEAKEAVER